MKNTLKVVLADDEALIRLDIREMLTEGGHEVAGEANNGCLLYTSDAADE